MLLLPAIDLRDGRCVRLAQGDFERTTHYEATPSARLSHYEALGASEVHLVDLDGARDGVPRHPALIHALARLTGVRLQAGGGVRSRHTVSALLAAGVGRVVIGSAAVERAAEVRGWLREFGPERICLAFDVRALAGEARVSTRGWRVTGTASLWQALEPFGADLRHVLCTDIERDGMLCGPNLELYAEARRRFPDLAWQASGGVRSVADLHALERIGVAAAISGKALLEDLISPEELRPFLSAASSPASTSATAAS